MLLLSNVGSAQLVDCAEVYISLRSVHAICSFQF
jgi:hypothetical protein